MDVQELAAHYASGLFPMDDPGAEELPWWVADPRAVFELDDASLDALERKVRRSLKAAEPTWTLVTDRHFDEVIEACSPPRGDDEGVWLTPRMHAMYRTLHAHGLAHTFELVDGDEPLAGIIGVTLGRAAMLESMCHWRSHAGNVLLVRTFRALADAGCELCDLQMLTPHTERLGARLIPREQYEARLAAALRLSPPESPR